MKGLAKPAAALQAEDNVGGSKARIFTMLLTRQLSRLDFNTISKFGNEALHLKCVLDEKGPSSERTILLAREEGQRPTRWDKYHILPWWILCAFYAKHMSPQPAMQFFCQCVTHSGRTPLRHNESYSTVQ